MSSAVIVAHHQRVEAAALAVTAATWLRQRGFAVWMPPADASALGLDALADARPPGEADLALSLGGDGTMLRTIDLLDGSKTTVLGVNVGQLGYLTEVEPGALVGALERYTAGDYEVEERMMLAVEAEPVGEARPRGWRALNEAVIERQESGHTVRLHVRIDGAPFTTYAADGLIVATPTGSTAYSLSARGPVVSPRHRALLLTPVSPHMLFDRALVLDPDETIEIEVAGTRSADLNVDGQRALTLAQGSVVRLQAAVGVRPLRAVRPPALPSDPEGQVRPGGPLMLSELVVRDLGVIGEARLLLGPGLTAVTGETGAGKTLLVEAVALLIGGRAEAGLVRPGASETVVEGRFLVGEDEVVLSRVVPAEGRSRAYVNGRLATVAELAEHGRLLVDLHGQHAHQSLLAGATQRAALDRFAAIDLEPLVVARQRIRRLEDALAALGGDARTRAREIDLLRYQVDELTRAELADAAEDERLIVEEEALADVQAHREAAQSALAHLGEDGARDAAAAAASILAGRGPFQEPQMRLVSLSVELDDVIEELHRVADGLDEDPTRLEEIGARRHLLHELRRKYGEALADVIAYRNEAATRLAELEAHDERVAELEIELHAARGAEAEVAGAVGRARRAAAPKLARAVQGHLADLAMPRARVAVAVEGGGEAREVTFELAANPGSPPGPIARVASGGELARAMLALRLVLTEAPDTLLFDEVDAGVGGEAALAVGRSLARLGQRHQVLAVTHLAQVAAFAEHQIVVDKRESGARTVVEARPVDGEDRVVELARMLSGLSASGSARRHAEELLDGARAAVAP